MRASTTRSSVAALSRPHGIRFFTLLEIMVAILVLTGILLILSVASFAVMDGWERVQHHTRTMDQMLTLDRTIEGLLANVIPFTWPDPEENNRALPVFRGEADAMQAAYMHPFNRKEDGAIRFFRLLAEDGELVVYYCERPPFPDDLDSEVVRRSVLIDGVASIALQYVDQEDGAPTLVDAWEDREYAPLGIWLRVHFDDDTTDDWLFRTAGAGYYERWGDWNQQAQDVRGGTRR